VLGHNPESVPDKTADFDDQFGFSSENEAHWDAVLDHELSDEGICPDLDHIYGGLAKQNPVSRTSRVKKVLGRIHKTLRAWCRIILR